MDADLLRGAGRPPHLLPSPSSFPSPAPPSNLHQLATQGNISELCRLLRDAPEVEGYWDALGRHGPLQRTAPTPPPSGLMDEEAFPRNDPKAEHSPSHFRSLLNALDGNGRTPLLCAVQQGQTDTVLYLLSKKDCGVKSGSGHASGGNNYGGFGCPWSPLLQAAKEGHVLMVKALTVRGRPRGETLFGWTALHWAG